MTVTPSYADIDAAVRRAIATYTHALDDGRTDDILATFVAGARVDIPGMGAHEGIDALRVAYDRWKPRRPQRHVVANTLVTQWDDHEAHAVSDLVFLLQGESGWAVQVVGRYHDVLVATAGGDWRFRERRAEFVV